MPSTTEKENQPRSNKQHYFWVTCKHCKQKLAIPPDWVFKYLERVQGYEREEEDSTTQK